MPTASRNISVRKKILGGIYLGVETGEIVGLLGRNGSGKSTLLKIISGNETAQTSYLKIGEKIIQNQWQRKGLIAYLPQYSFLPKNIRTEKLIPIFCSEENSEKLRNHPLIQPFLYSKIRELSGGEIRIVEILLILFSEAKFILLDEPFHSLSPKACDEIKIMIQNASKEKGIILTDHSYKNILEISDEIYLLKDTKINRIGSEKDLKFYHYLNP